MKLDVPIFQATQLTAAMHAPGLHLAANGAWLEGALVVPEPDAGAAEEWLRALVVVAISSANQVPRVARLARVDAYFSAPEWRSEAALARVTFAAHAPSLFARPLAHETQHVHLAARELLSSSVRLTPFARGSHGGAQLGDRLIGAYTLAFAGDWAAARAAFDELLVAGPARADLDAAHAYNAACAAARAHDRARALTLLGADLRRRCALHTQRLVASAVARAESAPNRRALDSLLDEHIARLRSDPDLESLRTDGAIEELLQTL